MAWFRKNSENKTQASDEFKAKTGFGRKLKSFLKRNELKEDFWDDFEELLLTSDVGVEYTEKIISSLKSLKTIDEVKLALKELVSKDLKQHHVHLFAKPHVIMVVGVNGTGKTTTIAKLANKFKLEGKKVLLVAGDTFRAAAIDQLQTWGERIGIHVVAQKPESDPAAVAFDGITSAKAKDYDVVILDTAGRLHTNKNLMDELMKVKRVSSKAFESAPHDVLLVLDATVGSNGLNQAMKFNDSLKLSGVIVAKMDGTAKGGVILSIASKLGLPVSYIGIGEKLEDLEEFSVENFIKDIIP